MASPTSLRSGYNCDPASLGMRDDESLCLPIDIVEEEPAYLTTSQSINSDQQQDCPGADGSRA
jgi:hypothetical protein